MFAVLFIYLFYFTKRFTLKKYNILCTYFRENLAESMEEDIVTIKEEISTVEDTCTVYVAEESVKEERTENQGMGKHFLHLFF